MNAMEREAIVQEVLRRLSPELGRGEGQNSGGQPEEARPFGLVLPDKPVSGELEDLSAQYALRYQLRILHPEKLNWDEEESAGLLHRPCDVLLIGLTLKSVADLALGLRSTAYTEVVTRLLLQGFRLHVISGEQVPAACPTAYRRMIAEYYARLVSFGISFARNYPDTDLNCQPEQDSAPELNREVRPKSDGKLLTARDISRLANKTILEVAPGTLITPLARDEAKQRAIEISEVNPRVFG